MKLKTLLLACSAATLIFSSCNSDSNSQSLKGKWSFNTMQGAYSELWLDGKSLLTVKSDSRNPFVFDYNQNGDTIVIYQHDLRGKKSEEVDRFLIEKHNGETVTILQDSVENKLQLISEDVGDIKNTKSYRDSVLLDFDSRAQSEQ
ncbi:hypothetical protein [Owenweeksia hongkongensis]|uniref:hypothetical protein n=1 Tax=Owenweeksia hongkongensis TaxID=253245 RepID=UPI003A8CE9EB